MGKRSNFKRKENDFYRTKDVKAVEPLIPHLDQNARLAELCAGANDLFVQLQSLDFMPVFSSDIAPQDLMVKEINAFDITDEILREFMIDYIVTNPPWSRAILHLLIEHFMSLRPTWLLFDADWKYTLQDRGDVPKVGGKTVSELMKYCVKVVAVGRVSWENNGKKGKDNCAWYLFDKNFKGQTKFYPKLGTR